jgi:hypothetical protein
VCVVLEIVTSVSEELGITIFRVEVTIPGMEVGYIGKVEG